MTATRRGFATGAAFALDVPPEIPAIWGDGDDILWSVGEALMIGGGQGGGKTTLAQQLMLARIGVRPPSLLTFPVQVDEDRPTVYLALDRPAQAQRSLHRMVTEADRPRLEALLKVWRGPPPFDITKDPQALATMLVEANAGTVVVDSLKDIALALAEDGTGNAINQARQNVIAAGIEVIELHHQRKGQGAGHKPTKLEDVYGSTWITAGLGSCLLLWGDPGDAYVELTQLKPVANVIGPHTVHHDHETGTSTIPAKADLVELAKAAGSLTVTEAASALYATDAPSKNQKEAARRRLDSLAKKGSLRRRDQGDGTVSYEHITGATVDPRGPSRGPSTKGSTPLHGLALDSGTDPPTPPHGAGVDTPPPLLRGRVDPTVDPLNDELRERAGGHDFAAVKPYKPAA